MSRSFTKPVKPAVKSEIKAAHMANHARCIEELQRNLVVQKKPAKKNRKQVKPPLWVTLRTVAPANPEDPPDWEVYAEYGHVVPRHNASAETGAPLAITSLPTDESPLAVVEDTKLWVKETISAYGKITGATWESGTNWPNDTPPELIGGDDQTGAEGYRYIRIAEIIANPNSTGTPPSLIRNQLHTGHIDHFQPELCENTTTSPSGGDARVYKTWNASAGRHDFRYLTDGAGITITENTDSIEIKADTGYAFPSSHPWKVTNAGSGNAAIAAGYVLGYYMVYSDANPMMQPSTVAIFPPDEITLAAGSSYAGGTAAITGTQYIYAEIPRNGPTTEYTEARQDYAGVGIASDTTAELYDDIEPSDWTSGAPTDTASIVVSNDEPGTYVPTTGKAAVCIAKAVNNSGTISVTQYVTHNPTVFIPIPWTGTVVTL